MAATPAPEPAQITEEVKYPDREMILVRTGAVERNSGAVCFRFVHDFRCSCFHNDVVLNKQQQEQLNPPRSDLVSHLISFAPSYQYPKCFVENKDLKCEVKVKNEGSGEIGEKVKFEWKKESIEQDDVEEDENDNGSNDEDEEKKNEEDENEDLIGEYNVAQYEDLETGEDMDNSDGSDDY